MNREWTALPNFVDCTVFRPAADDAEKHRLRESLGIPPEAFVVGCVAAVKRHHKRVDYLIRETARLSSQSEEASCEGAKARSEEIIPSAGGGMPLLTFAASRLRVRHSSPYLLVAGARTGDTDELMAMAESLMPGRCRILTDCTRERMPELYRCMDVFVLTSLFEMMPIALLEALASGLPCLVNRHPVLEWMIGEDPLSSCQVAELAGQRLPGCALTTVSPLAGHDQPGRAATPLAAAAVDGASALPGHERTITRRFLTTEQPSNLTTAQPPAGGAAIDMSRDGALTEALAGLTPEWIAERGRLARERALRMFDKPVVIGQYVEYYRRVLGG